MRLPGRVLNWPCETVSTFPFRALTILHLRLIIDYNRIISPSQNSHIMLQPQTGSTCPPTRATTATSWTRLRRFEDPAPTGIGYWWAFLRWVCRCGNGGLPVAVSPKYKCLSKQWRIAHSSITNSMLDLPRWSQRGGSTWGVRGTDREWGRIRQRTILFLCGCWSVWSGRSIAAVVRQAMRILSFLRRLPWLGCWWPLSNSHKGYIGVGFAGIDVAAHELVLHHRPVYLAEYELFDRSVWLALPPVVLGASDFQL